MALLVSEPVCQPYRAQAGRCEMHEDRDSLVLLEVPLVACFTSMSL